MGNEKHGDDPAKPIDLASSDPGSLKARKKKISKQEAQKLRDFRLTAPCFLGNIPCRQRSKRRVKSKNSISKQTNRLDSGAFECYMEKLWSSFPEEKRTSFAYFDCQWFAWYRKASFREKVLSWIKREQIFSKKYVLVPVVCCLQSETKTPCMLLLDSLEIANPRRLEPDIRKFVLDIYRAEGRPEKKEMIYRIPLLVPKVPQQRDGEECGKFVLYFINLFVEGAPENFSIEGYPYFMRKDWFNAEGVECFCEKLDSFGK
ncbi:Cysteine proteinases superfamily protein, putative isoform 5 [Theobroma cacao]|uniref:Cysteine proteinases superfamily protein, putative isoform 5 n=1 Tax=Theobroma cacao TaxID=3641 RepID=A0A061FZR3_THECC|nr:Cysteine proteinases superfamily protein, putative isoform 5 [Theobroma cacao]